MQKMNIADQLSPASRNAGHAKRGLLDSWYRLAAQPEVATASFRERELTRKMRSSSIAILTILILFILFLPGCFVFQNRLVLYPEFAMMPICLIALIINKNRHPILAGALVLFSFELALIFVCLTTRPFDGWDVQLYELFVLSEVMALTLVSPRGMIIVGACNVVFIILDVIFQPYHSPELTRDLQTQFAAIVIMPVSIQIMVAVVVGWYAGNQRKTVQQANRAEMLAQLEHHQLEQSKKVEQEKLALQQHIEQIVSAHAQTMNTHTVAKIPLESFPPLFWPLINVFNSQQARLKRSWDIEVELQRLQQAIMQSSENAMSGRVNFNQSTGTQLDLLLSALKRSRSR